MMVLRRLSGDEIAVIRKSVWMAGDWGRRQSISGGSSSIQTSRAQRQQRCEPGTSGSPEHWYTGSLVRRRVPSDTPVRLLACRRT